MAGEPLLAVKDHQESSYIVNVDLCRGCRRCLKTGCPAIGKPDHKAVINQILCRSCGDCAKICPQGAIIKEDEM